MSAQRAVRDSRCYGLRVSTTTRAELHSLVDELPEETVETARRFLKSLRVARKTSGFIARYIESMDPGEAALLDGLSEMDRDQGAPGFVADDAEPRNDPGR
jgi:hypothetical protein